MDTEFAPGDAPSKIAFAIKTFPAGWAQPSYKNEAWTVGRPTLGYDDNDSKVLKPDGSSIAPGTHMMNRILEELKLATNPDNMHIARGDILGDQNEEDYKSYLESVEYINKWKTDLVRALTERQFKGCNKGLPYHWNNVVSFVLTHLIRTHDTGNHMTMSVRTLDSLKGKDDLRRQAIMTEYGVATNEAKQMMLQRNIANVRDPSLWVVVGQSRGFDPEKSGIDREAMQSKLESQGLPNASRVIKKDSTKYGSFKGFDPAFHVFVIPSIVSRSNSPQVLSSMNEMGNAISGKIREVFSDREEENQMIDNAPPHKKEYSWKLEDKDQYAREETQLIQSRETQLRDTVEGIANSLIQSLVPNKDFLVNVLSGQDYQIQKHSLDRTNDNTYMNWATLPHDLEEEYKTLLEYEQPRQLDGISKRLRSI